MNKLILLLFWAAFLFAGSWKIGHRINKPPAQQAVSPKNSCLTTSEKRGMPHLLARNDMVVNWRIDIADLSEDNSIGKLNPNDFVGKYLACRVSAGDPVVPDEVTRKLEIPVAAGG